MKQRVSDLFLDTSVTHDEYFGQIQEYDPVKTLDFGTVLLV